MHSVCSRKQLIWLPSLCNAQTWERADRPFLMQAFVFTSPAACFCRVWSVAHSQHRPHLCASSSDDGTAHLWAGRGLSERVGQIRLPSSAPIAGVSFCAENEHALALAASDCSAYVYDIRNLSEPIQVCTRLRCNRYFVSTSLWLQTMPTCLGQQTTPYVLVCCKGFSYLWSLWNPECPVSGCW